MSKLFSLKKWLSLEEAATYLTSCLNETVKQGDIIRLAIDGHLTLSVNFVNSVFARCGKAIPVSEHTGGGIPFDGHEVLMFEDGITRISGIYDLPMIGGEIYDCEHKFQKLTGGPLVLMGEVRGAFVRSFQSGDYYQIQKYFPAEGEHFDWYEARLALSKWDWKARIFDDVMIEHFIEKGGELKSQPSRDEIFVMRTSAIQDFIESMVQPISDKVLGATERKTLLTIIAAMAVKGLHLNVDQPGKAATYIEGLTDELGAHVSKRAIEDHLKKIPDALETRMK